jgi:hypothetical protein
VFIRGLRAKKRLLQILPAKIMAAAEPKSDDDGLGEDGDVSMSIEVEDLTGQPEVRVGDISYFALVLTLRSILTLFTLYLTLSSMYAPFILNQT